MDFVWSPWRFHYITENAGGRLHQDGCVFCRAPAAEDPATTLVAARGKRNYIILNLFPYTSGHLMVVPYEHVSALTDLDSETTAEMMDMVKRTQRALTQVYGPDGFNIGLNQGKAAGAGIEQHLHMHIVPRWVGDANFVSVIGETRVIPEAMETTYEKIARQLADLD